MSRKYVGDGISKTSAGYELQVIWPPPYGDGKRHRIPLPRNQNGVADLRVAKSHALRIKTQDRYSEGWAPPTVAREREAAEVAASRWAAKDRADLVLFDNAVQRYLDDQIRKGSDAYQERGAFERLAYAFAGTPLDHITARAIKDYYHDRMNRTGPYSLKRREKVRFLGKTLQCPFPWKDTTRKISACSPKNEVWMLSSLWKFVTNEIEDENAKGAGILPLTSNPTLRATAPSYTPEHIPFIPSKDEVRLLLEEATGQIRAFIALGYYTGSRGGAICALRKGDVDLPVAGSGEWGEVRYGKRGQAKRQDKTPAGTRSVLLHPEASKYLRGLVGKPPKHPGREAGKAKLAAYEDRLQAWREEPIFVGPRTGKAWDRLSYRLPWERTRDRVAAKLDNPKLEKMVFHDWRRTLKTRVINAGLSTILADKIMGHKTGDMAALYYVAEVEQVKRALSTLSLTGEPEVHRGVL